ncbi:hypothetical protein FWK35_00014337, partial [Aphis craccivora]
HYRKHFKKQRNDNDFKYLLLFKKYKYSRYLKILPVI